VDADFTVSPKGKFNKAKYDEWKNLSDKLSAKGEKIPRIIISPLQKAIRIAVVFLLLVSVGATIAWRITSQKLAKSDKHGNCSTR
jgi:hypothetical protein